MDMRVGDEKIGSVYTFAVVVRGELEHINMLIDFLKSSELIIAHHEIGQEKMYIKRDANHEYQK
jgi:hypothetical protein